MSWQDQLRSIPSEAERELFSTLRRYGASKDHSPADVARPCSLALRLVPSDPEFPYQLDDGLTIRVDVPLAYPDEPADFVVSCNVALFERKYADDIARHLRDRQALFPHQLVLRKTLTWLDNHLKDIISHRSSSSVPAPPTPLSPSAAAAASTTIEHVVAVESTVVSSPRGGSSSVADKSKRSIALTVEIHAPVPPCESPRSAAADTPSSSKKRRACRFFAVGKCKNGDDCVFAHVVKKPSTPAARGIKTTTQQPSTDDASGVSTDDVDASTTTDKTSQSKKKKKTKSAKSSPPPNDVDDEDRAGTTAASPTNAQDTRQKDGGKPTRNQKAGPSTPQEAGVPGAIDTARQKKVKTPRARKPAPTAVQPDKVNAPATCRFFALGKCTKGNACRFQHESVVVPEAESCQADDGDPRSLETAPTPRVERKPSAITHESPRSSGSDNDAAAADRDVWTAAQQRQLDQALKRFPARAMEAKVRWRRIADCVEDKTMKECIARYKRLAEFVKGSSSSHPQPATTTAVGSPQMPASVAPTQSDNDTVQPDDIVDDDSATTTTDARIIPAAHRVKLDLEPDPKAIHIQLGALFLHQIDTLQLHAWKCAFACAQCPLTFDSILTLTNHAVRQWCRRCSVLQTIELRPVLMHRANDVAVNLHLINCTLVDLMPPSVFLAVCSACTEEALLAVVPRIRSEVTCRHCHVKMAVECKAFTILNQSNDHFVDHSQPKMKKKVLKDEGIVVGQSLPNAGRCAHYSKSLRWFRFQCCGKAYPCDICHKASSCVDADKGIFASRFICGLCSREHPSQLKECPCGNVLGATTTSVHWEGGKGCRDSVRMSSADPRKYTGAAKTKSMKFKRVGLEAKKRREAQKGAGGD
ncbi:Aste57867_18652 [Aphanomyces stellatus]|uniref:Aste57867_18652 protein n=1 Tax=Aphanomyces stellatus TaxID=120398 RepID=A0A485LBJ3_9STRA|nr:hypothetical protein As57867_018590 [Aphanomyces stellatus]VFT95387.1 Aste57867_18652 [Aphanomyces stellatus]